MDLEYYYQVTRQAKPNYTNVTQKNAYFLCVICLSQEQ